MEGRGNSSQHHGMPRLTVLSQYSTEVELLYSPTFGSSLHQEIIFSNHIIQSHSLGYENAFLLHFSMFTLKLHFLGKR
jgi:hypothetical protein